jgi:dTDP-4-amino-4,6-dideoxygalactose transaminase
MTGIPEFNHPAFAATARLLRAAGLEVVSPHELHDGDTSREYAYYLRRDLQALLGCETLALLPGWETSRGAQLERQIAEALGMPIVRMEKI